MKDELDHAGSGDESTNELEYSTVDIYGAQVDTNHVRPRTEKLRDLHEQVVQHRSGRRVKKA